MGISLVADTLGGAALLPFVQARHDRGTARGHRLGWRGRPDARDETQSWADARCPHRLTVKA